MEEYMVYVYIFIYLYNFNLYWVLKLINPRNSGSPLLQNTCCIGSVLVAMKNPEKSRLGEKVLSQEKSWLAIPED